MTRILVGTRRSALATTQTGQVIAALQAAHPDVAYATREIVTKGDRIQDVALAKVGGKGLFISEIEEALLCGEVDLAVHSMKDVPAELADGLMIGAVPKRAEVRDVLISAQGYTLRDLPEGAVVGTSSLRRSAQLQKLRPDLRIEPLRGNIDTRLRKVGTDTGITAIVLAGAGIERMGWWQAQDGSVGPYALMAQPLSVEEMLPAVGQGALCIECRVTDDRIERLLGAVHDPDTALCARAERAFLAAVGGSCQVPVAAYAQVVEVDGQAPDLLLRALIAAPDGQTVVAQSATGHDPDALGAALGEQLLRAGGQSILVALS